MVFDQVQTKILLLGAGELGTAFLPHLQTLPDTHITVDLAGTFAEYDILISAIGFGADPSTVLKLANEVLAAGKIKKENSKGNFWFFPWQWGVDYDTTGSNNGLMLLFGAQRDVRNLLREKAKESNVTWTVVSTGIFMSFLFEPFWGIVDRSREASDEQITVRCLRDWYHKVTVTHVNDIGRVLSRILFGDVEAGNRVVYVAGDTVSYGDLADIVERVSGMNVDREMWDMGRLEEELRKNPDDGIKKYRLVFAGGGVWWDKEKTVNRQLEMSMTDVESYAKSILGRSCRDSR
ncbi:hypothetical protein BDW02DRAFT_620099 [Decorospora gaudefroyi]|uniref:NmrA-like domain-containing protein n=1 Tax=Decorospora gaudefroyi TaxID=184978 RepID=A0A6A5KNZ1_9PLEO|nr:hypothetical protein BDW02DRAFT_620099 [Decorospora gaudefroyi]